MISNQKRLERLRNLLRVMNSVARKPKAAYDITTICKKFETKADMASYVGDDLKKMPPCKTVACTAGWAGLDPYFRRSRFTTDPETERVLIRGVEVSFGFCGGSCCEGKPSPADFFGITQEEGRSLFLSGPPIASGYVTAQDVAGYIRTLIKQYSKQAKK